MVQRHLYYSKKRQQLYVFKGDWSISYADQLPILKNLGDLKFICSAFKPRLLNVSHFCIKTIPPDTLVYVVNEKSILEFAQTFRYPYDDLWNIVYLYE